MEGPESVVVKAGVHHYVEAQTDALWLCVHIGEHSFSKD
jgi:hypothetical protein